MRSLLILVLILTVGCQSDKEKKTTREWMPDIRLASKDDLTSLDPRLVRDLITVTPLHMLFEGLTTVGLDGKLQPAVAESWSISNDHLTYTFKLRTAYWSNGDVITAQDFEETWKTILDPRFPAPNAYQLYVIKGAKEAKEGRLALDDIGVYTQDANTLIVTLESPTPYFLELLTTHFYFPVHADTRESHGEHPEGIISNGPFKFNHWKHHNEFGVSKNPYYWDVSQVKLNAIALVIVDENTALQLFEHKDVDWVGSPLSTLPQDAVQTLKNQGRLKVSTAAGTHWFRLNTSKQPFDQSEIRRAFAYALNRKDIVEHVTQGNQLPALGIIPPSMKDDPMPFFVDNEEQLAQELIEKGLSEKNITPAEFPSVTLLYAMNDRNHKIAQTVQEQWNKVFGITVQLDGCESQLFFYRLKQKDYQIALGSWYADIRDPVNFLEVFKFSKNATNNTEWENPIYIALLDLSQNELDAEKRANFLNKAEALLVEEMPVVPLFFGSYNYLKADRVKGVYFSDLGYLDFKHASVE